MKKEYIYIIIIIIFIFIIKIILFGKYYNIKSGSINTLVSEENIARTNWSEGIVACHSKGADNVCKLGEAIDKKKYIRTVPQWSNKISSLSNGGITYLVDDDVLVGVFSNNGSIAAEPLLKYNGNYIPFELLTTDNNSLTLNYYNVRPQTKLMGDPIDGNYLIIDNQEFTIIYYMPLHEKYYIIMGIFENKYNTYIPIINSLRRWSESK